MPCPHYDIKIIQRSNHQSVVASAAYQSGDRLFSEYDQRQKYYSHKSGIVHKEIMLPSHAPPEYLDRNTLWNSAEAAEKQWNAQLARRIVLAIPREIPSKQYADLLRDYCQEFFVSKGMCCDFAIHDKGDGNPHAHILLTMRAIDEQGKWMSKSRKVYDLDENGQRIRLKSGRWKSHKENTVDWNDQKYAEIWRQGWADIANRYLQMNQCPERLDLRSYKRQGIDKIPTVHMGPAVSQLEKRGIQTNIGNLNRDIKAANGMMQSIRQLIYHLKSWIADLKEKRQALMDVLSEANEPTLQELLAQYIELRQKEREGWNSKGQLKGAVSDYEKVFRAIDYLKSTKISTVEELDCYLESTSQKANAIRQSMKIKENRMKMIDTMLLHIQNYEKYKPIYTEYSSIRWKGKKQKFAETHKKELDDFMAATRYLKKHLEGKTYDKQMLIKERSGLVKERDTEQETLQEIQSDVKELRNIRYFVSKVLPDEKVELPVQETQEKLVIERTKKKRFIHEQLADAKEKANRENMMRRQQQSRQRKQNMEL